MRVIIVGGGASGLVAAIRLGKEHEVTIIEKANDIGKKILVTGNGHCNYFNKDMSIDHYLTSNEGINELISEDYVYKVLPFFESIGVLPYQKDNYYYPASYEARTVRYFLIKKIKDYGINVVLSEEVVNIEKKDYEFHVTTDRNVYKADKVIVSTGGSSYELLTKLGHNVIPLAKALCGIKGNREDSKYWGGIRIKANLKLFINDNLVKEENGDLQLTDYGISGICSMNLSNYVGRLLLQRENHYILINFIPSINSYEEFTAFIEDGNKKFNNDIKSTLYQVLNDKLVDILLNGIDKNKLEEVYSKFCKYRFNPKELNDLNGQVTSGGIPLDEVNLTTMESKVYEGIYITGELLNVVGDCGGYNLGLAWITALKAGDAINAKN